MRPCLPLGVKRRISVESTSPFLKAVERQACTIRRPGMVCSMRPESAPLKALNFAPGLAPMATLRPVIAACFAGLRYIAYKLFAAAGRTTDCLTILGILSPLKDAPI